MHTALNRISQNEPVSKKWSYNGISADRLVQSIAISFLLFQPRGIFALWCPEISVEFSPASFGNGPSYRVLLFRFFGISGLIAFGSRTYGIPKTHPAAFAGVFSAGQTSLLRSKPGGAGNRSAVRIAKGKYSR